MRRSLFAAVFAAAMLPSVPSFGQQPPPDASGDTVSAIDVKPGDTWVYRSMNEITGQIASTNTYTVTEITPQAITTAVTFDGGPGRVASNVQQFSANWGLAKGVDWTFSKPDMTQGVQLPMKVGSKWQTAFSATRISPSATFRVKGHSAVVGREQVNLPSGESYTAFKIEAETVAVSTAGVKTVTDTTQWFAPEVNRYVQRTVETRTGGMLSAKTNEYLLSYERRAPA